MKNDIRHSLLKFPICSSYYAELVDLHYILPVEIIKSLDDWKPYYTKLKKLLDKEDYIILLTDNINSEIVTEAIKVTLPNDDLDYRLWSDTYLTTIQILRIKKMFQFKNRRTILIKFKTEEQLLLARTII